MVSWAVALRVAAPADAQEFPRQLLSLPVAPCRAHCVSHFLALSPPSVLQERWLSRPVATCRVLSRQHRAARTQQFVRCGARQIAASPNTCRPLSSLFSGRRGDRRRNSAANFEAFLGARLAHSVRPRLRATGKSPCRCLSRPVATGRDQARRKGFDHPCPQCTRCIKRRRCYPQRTRYQERTHEHALTVLPMRYPEQGC